MSSKEEKVRPRRNFNLDRPQDLEMALQFLEDLSSDEEQMDNATTLDVVLIPPDDGCDSDMDDAGSDEDGAVFDLGKKILAQPAEIHAVTGDAKSVYFSGGKKVSSITDPFECSSTSDSPIQSGETSMPENEELVDHSEASSTAIGAVRTDKKYLRRKKNKEVEPAIPPSPCSEPGIFSGERPQPKKKRKVTKNARRNWEHFELTTNDSALQQPDDSEPDFVKKIKEDNLSPVDLFKTVFNEDFMTQIVKESVKYAVGKGHPEFCLSIDELYQYLAIILLSGYVPLPNRRNFWETRSDTFNFLVSNAMTRNRFEAIHRFLHFSDNQKIDKSDKLYKVKPLVEHCNKVFQDLIKPLGTRFSIDEAMEPYYGRHSMKQFIRGKPIRFGFKQWCLCTSLGYLIKFIPYTGASSANKGKTPLGSSVTETLCDGLLPRDSFVYIDNFFNSLRLLEALKANGINCIGTIRADRIEDAPLKDLKKEPRGASYAVRDTKSQLTIIRWHDNSQVTMATNIRHDVAANKGSCQRWSRSHKAKITVDQPALIQLYNKGMGGVVIFDRQRGLYRSKIRSKKWYWPIVRFCLNGAVVNLWVLYRQAYGKFTLLEFVRAVVIALLQSAEKGVPKGPRPRVLGKVPTEVRLDGKGHLVDSIATQRRCAKCGKCAKFRCVKCNVGLHPANCFVAHHS